jgi:hypothetical protein
MSIVDDFNNLTLDDLRQQVIDLLKEAYTDGRISVESLERRLGEATAAESKERLIAIADTVPAPKRKRRETGGRDTRGRTGNGDSEPLNLYAFLSSAVRSGRWVVPRNISAVSFLGSVKLDFRDAEFPRGDVEISANCVLGDVDIIVPEGPSVIVTGMPVVGSMDNKAGEGDPEAPTIRVNGFALLGSVKARRKPPRRKRGK